MPEVSTLTFFLWTEFRNITFVLLKVYFFVCSSDMVWSFFKIHFVFKSLHGIKSILFFYWSGRIIQTLASRASSHILLGPGCSYIHLLQSSYTRTGWNIEFFLWICDAKHFSINETRLWALNGSVQSKIQINWFYRGTGEKDQNAAPDRHLYQGT